MDDLISRKSLLSAYDEKHKGPAVGARKLIEDEPFVPAVPLAKLCEYLNSVIYPCIICKESPGPQCNAKRKGCWDRVLTKWMEEQDAAD